MRVEPKSDEDFAREGSGPRELLRDGVYEFDVKDAIERQSSTGNAMIELVLNVYDNRDGVARLVWDYLVDGKMGWKVRHFAETVGLLRQYEAGYLEAADLPGKSGRVKIGREAARADYAAKNKVVDYEPPSGKAAQPARQAAQPGRQAATTTRRSASDLDDEIPF